MVALFEKNVMKFQLGVGLQETNVAGRAYIGIGNKVSVIGKGVAQIPQFIVRPGPIIALKQEETWSNKGIEMARRLV